MSSMSGRKAGGQMGIKPMYEINMSVCLVCQQRLDVWYSRTDSMVSLWLFTSCLIFQYIWQLVVCVGL